MTAPPLRLQQLVYPVESLGPGRRLGVWFQGCPLSCRGCMAQDTWDAGGGLVMSVAEVAEKFEAVVADGADGVTVSGGEPTAQPPGLGALLAAIDAGRTRLTAPDGAAAGRTIDVLVYTGYDRSELDAEQQAALRHADVVVTGRFRVNEPTSLIWRGSANQEMWLRTLVGEQRYAEYVDHVPPLAPMQMHVTDDGVRVIGVPRRGDLARVERRLRDLGFSLGTPTWRPNAARERGS